MDLENEIHFNPGAVLQRQPRSDPPLRLGDQRLAARQRHRAAARRHGLHARRLPRGPFAGNDVPLVSRYTASGGVTWNIWQNYLVFDATVRAWSERIMDNDQANTQRRIPAERNRRFETERRLRSLLLVAERQQSVRCAVLRLRHRQFVHARPLRGLSVARTYLHGEGRRDVLIRAAGSASCRTGLS